MIMFYSILLFAQYNFNSISVRRNESLMLIQMPGSKKFNTQRSIFNEQFS